MIFRLKNRHACLIIAIFGCIPFQSTAEELKSPLSAIYACSSILDDAQRLACFDKNVPVLQVKESKKEFIAIDSEQAKTIERESFGFSLPSLPKFGLINSKDDKSKSSVQTFNVKTLSKTRRGITLTTENNQVWQQSSGDSGYIPKNISSVTIKPGAFGTFFAMLKNDKGQKSSKGIRVKRIE